MNISYDFVAGYCLGINGFEPAEIVYNAGGGGETIIIFKAQGATIGVKGLFFFQRKSEAEAFIKIDPVNRVLLAKGNHIYLDRIE